MVGDQVSEYRLTEEQAILLCMGSDAPRAADVHRVHNSAGAG